VTVKQQETATMDEIMKQYLAAAIKFGDTQRSRDFESGNESATVLGRLGKLLRESEEGQRLLGRYLIHDDPYVRVWVAKDCLFFNPDAGASVLEAIEKTAGLLGTTARMTLSEWKAGRLFKHSQ
jgi:hypothetical protein